MADPGWRLVVRTVNSDLAGNVLDDHRVQRAENDWIKYSCNGSVFEATGGPLNLEEILMVFRHFAERKVV